MTACQPSGSGGYLDGPAEASPADIEEPEYALLLLFFLADLAVLEPKYLGLGQWLPCSSRSWKGVTIRRKDSAVKGLGVVCTLRHRFLAILGASEGEPIRPAVASKMHWRQPTRAEEALDAAIG